VDVVADESVLGFIVRALRSDGHVVEYIAETAPGIADPDVLDAANATEAVLLTADKDFGELVIRLRRLSHGVVLYRLADLARCSDRGRVGGIPRLWRGAQPVLHRDHIRRRQASFTRLLSRGLKSTTELPSAPLT
jgi:hypothetical protein